MTIFVAQLLCRILSCQSFALVLLTSSAFVHQGIYTSRLQEGFHLSLRQVTSATMNMGSSTAFWVGLIPELQTATLATTLVHQSVALRHHPSPNLQLLFVLQDSSSRATLGSQLATLQPALRHWTSWLPDLHLGRYYTTSERPLIRSNRLHYYLIQTGHIPWPNTHQFLLQVCCPFVALDCHWSGHILQVATATNQP